MTIDCFASLAMTIFTFIFSIVALRQAQCDDSLGSICQDHKSAEADKGPDLLGDYPVNHLFVMGQNIGGDQALYQSPPAFVRFEALLKKRQ